MVFEQVGVLQVRVEFNLIDRGRNCAGFQNVIQLFGQVVTNADRFGESLALQLFHLLPFRLMVGFVFAEEWGMDEVAVFLILAVVVMSEFSGSRIHTDPHGPFGASSDSSSAH